MFTVFHPRWPRTLIIVPSLMLGLILVSGVHAEDAPAKTAVKKTDPSQAIAKSEAEMKPYTQEISGTEVSFDMVPIPGGTFKMGSPTDEPGRKADEGPQHPVTVEPFWMGKCEVTWDEYDIWTFSIDIQRRETLKLEKTEYDKKADAIVRCTRPYMDMTFDMGHRGYPAISMTQLAAKQYCEWLSAKTGHYYRLPTEAEWEYACRAGTDTAYSFGDDPAKLGEYAWYWENSDFEYQKVGQKKPNPWGLHDMHGNVAEWVLDQYLPDAYSNYPTDKPTLSPLVVATKRYPRTVRGGSWEDDPELLRSAARKGSHPDWKAQDPQLPKSVWYHTDALGLGFRVVRPLNPPTEAIRKRLNLGPVIPEDARIFGQGLYDDKDLSSFDRE